MAERALEQRVENLEHRVATVEQIVPTLATKTDLAELRIATKADIAEVRTAMQADLAELRTSMQTEFAEVRTSMQADLAELRTETKADLAELRAATQADLQAAIAPLATKAEVKADIKAEGELTRRHFDVVAEGLRAEIRLIADGHAAMEASNKATRTDIERSSTSTTDA